MIHSTTIPTIFGPALIGIVQDRKRLVWCSFYSNKDREYDKEWMRMENTLRQESYSDDKSNDMIHTIRSTINGDNNKKVPFEFFRGTPFQYEVWSAICDIPKGQTATYSDIARRIGKPNAVRAVANACKANHIAVIIPCHRVVASNGFGGYRWGVDKKIALLTREKSL